MCSLSNHDLLSYSFHSVSHSGFLLSKPWTAAWTWTNAGCQCQSHIPSPSALALWHIIFLFSVLHVFSHQPFSISHIMPCRDRGSSSVVAVCLSNFSPLPAQGDTLFQATSYSPVCFILSSSFLLHWFSLSVFFKSIINFNLKSIINWCYSYGAVAVAYCWSTLGAALFQ